MKTYEVQLPISGSVYVEVEAENEDEAIGKALEADWTMNDVQEVNVYRKLTEGNIWYGDCTEANAEEIK